MVTYTALAVTAVSFARGRSGARPSENNRVERFTADVLEHSGGRWIVGAIGVAVIAVGLYFAYQGITGRFSDELQGRDVGPVPHDTIVKLGQVGWCGRAVMTALIGFFLVRAAAMAHSAAVPAAESAMRATAPVWLASSPPPEALAVPPGAAGAPSLVAIEMARAPATA